MTFADAPINATQVPEFRQCPIQIKLMPLNAPYLDGSHLLIAVDGCAAYGNFHSDYMKNKVMLIGCPKLNDSDYSENFTEILKQKDIKSVTVERMEVPCCGGIENAVKTVPKNSDKLIL